MKKPGCNKCCVPFYCSPTNYECKRSTVNTLLMTETADVLFSLLISLGRVPLIKKRLFGRGGGGGVILRSIFTEYVPLVSQTIPWPIIDTIVVTFWLCIIL